MIIASVAKDGDEEYSVTSIGEYALSYCGDGLTSVTIPNSVIEIGEYAFNGCSSLMSVTIPNSVTSIGEGAFGGCTGLTRINVAIDNPAYSSIEGVLYNKNASILISSPGAKISANIPNSVTEIGEYAFYGYSGLTSVTIPNSVTTIGKGAFYFCSGLPSVAIPNSVTSIGNHAFCSCNGLTSVNIPNSVVTIGDYAFNGCSGMTSVTIPSSVKSIGDHAFSSCEKLAEVNYNTTSPITGDLYIFDFNTYESATLNVAIGGLSEASWTEPWKNFRNIKEKEFNGIEEAMIDIDPNASVDVFNLNGIRISDSVNNLPAGIYIVRQGAKEQKIMVK